MKRQRRRKLDTVRIDANVELVRARTEYVKWPPRFYQYLVYNRSVTGPVGKVARFAIMDYHCWPIHAQSKNYILRHLRERHGSLIGEKHGVRAPSTFDLHEAFRLYYEFVASRKQIPSRGKPEQQYVICRYTSFTPEAWRMLNNDLCNPKKRAEGVETSRPAVIEEAVRLLHATIFGKRTK